MSSSKNSLTNAEKKLIAILGALQFSHIVDFMIIMPLGPQLMELFKISPTQFGILVSSYTFSAGVVNLISAHFMDRLDRKKALLFFSIGFAISTLFCAVAQNYYSLLVARLITGCFGGVVGSIIVLIVSDTVSYEKRGFALGLLATSFSLASVLGVPFSIYIANIFNWHMPFFILGALAAIMCFIIFFTVPPTTSHIGKNKKTFFEMIINIFQTQALWTGLGFMITLVIGQFLIIPYISPSLVSNVGFKQSELPYIYIVGGLSSMIAAPLIGKISDIYGKKNIFLISAVLSLLPLYLITHLTPQPMIFILIQISLFFILTSGRMVPATALISEIAPKEVRGSYMTLTTALQQLAMGGGSFLAAQIVDKSTDGKILNYDRVGFLAMLGTLTAILFVNRIHIKEKSQLD